MTSEAEHEEAAVRAERDAEWWAPEAEHITEVMRVGSWGECSTTCTCGWVGPTTYRGPAEAAAQQHLEESR